MEVQTLVLSESELNRLTSEAGLGAITFTTSDGLTIPIHHFDLTSAVTRESPAEIAHLSELSYDGTSVEAEDGDPSANETINIDVAEESSTNDGDCRSEMSHDHYQLPAAVGSTITLDVTEMLKSGTSADIISLLTTALTSSAAGVGDVVKPLELRSSLENVDGHQQVECTDHKNKDEPDQDHELVQENNVDVIIKQEVIQNDNYQQPFDGIDSTISVDYGQLTIEETPVRRGSDGDQDQDDLDVLEDKRPSTSDSVKGDHQPEDNTQGDGGDCVSSNMVVIDVSKPIQLAQNSLIVVNGQKCVLQQNRETGQLIAYPVKEPTKAPKKRGRPKKSTILDVDVAVAERPSLTNVKRPADGEAPDVDVDIPIVNQQNSFGTEVEENMEESKVQGLVEMANEDGEIVKRSARKRKKVVLKEYETGRIRITDQSDDDEPVIQVKDVDDDVDALPIKKSRYLAKKPPKKACRVVIKSGRKRGRPRRYPIKHSEAASSTSDQPKSSSTQSFLIHMVDGRTMMMHVPMTSMPSGVSVQNIAQSIADSLNAPSAASSQVQLIQKTELVSPTKTSGVAPLDGSVRYNSEDTTTDNYLSEIVAENLTNLVDLTLSTSTSTEQQLADVAIQTNEQKPSADVGVVQVQVSPDLQQIKPNFQIRDLVVENVTKMASSAASDQDRSLTVVVAQRPRKAANAPTVIPLSPNETTFDVRDTPIRIGLKKSGVEQMEKLRCSKCDFQAYYSRQFQDHLASTHMDDAHNCKCCGYLTLIKADLIEHVKAEHPKNFCDVCNYHASKTTMLRRHMGRHKESKTSSLACEYCGKTYKDPYILRIHIKHVHLPAEIIFECSLCGKKFTRKAHLKRHLRLHDPEMKQFACDSCDYRSFERADITKHQLIHQDPKHGCEVCGKAFRHLKNKELHLKRHNGQRDYKCGVCDFFGYTFTDIRRHIERRHADPKTILCENCGQAFKTEQLRKDHQTSDLCELYKLETAMQEAEQTDSAEVVDDDLHNFSPVESSTSATLIKATEDEQLVATNDQRTTILEFEEDNVQKEQQQLEQQFCTMITVDGKVISSIVMDASELARFTQETDQDTNL